MTETQALRGIVEARVNNLREQQVLISAPFVARQIVRGFPHAHILHPEEWTAAYIGVAQIVRELLRKRHEDEYDAESCAQINLDLPESSMLNAAYSVMRNDEPFYVPRDQLTREDMEYVCSRFDRLSGYYAKHSRALRSEWERRNSGENALFA